jgi:hypothetical protein
MWYPVELSLSSYLPDELEVGMLFANRISVGVIEPYIELFELKEIPEDPDAFMSKHGAPVSLVIVDGDDNVIATHEDIGWWDEGDHTDELRDITLDDINLIARDWQGALVIEVDDDTEELILIEDRVVLSLDQEDDWDETLNEGLEPYEQELEEIKRIEKDNE